ncbi:MAG TPA: PQQ-binding-like beta-propeller repeat protein [Candidatus Hydrogenedentes bacterium]|nr:PQQ-binding-like beta-propeller repeat protein [Candidatus Hydrogenedentota bacterium]HOL78010.1 PQQ-binding-like beta-propeller repeat protein [Candidatus Hydrogenedentota bacterium]HPO87070.1 PQQ-binding-like beta-propeller repeat protein [Candidatus Hydrogenedentota bacterium]
MVRFLRFSISFLFCVLYFTCATGDLRVTEKWTLRGEGGFSAVCPLRAEGKNLKGFVDCEVNRGVVCFDSDGKELWSFPLTPPVTAAPAVADLTGDTRQEVIAADAKGRLVVLSDEGKLLWEVALPAGVSAASCPAVADLWGKGQLYVLVGDVSGALSCFNAKGELVWRFTGDGTQMGPVCVYDVYDTPGAEIIVTSHDRHIYALSARGEWLWDIYRENDLFPNSNPILADVNGDHSPELYIGGGLHHFYKIDLAKASVVLEQNVHMHINGAIEAADIDGDGADEVVFGTKAGVVWCYGKEGLRWKREFRRSVFMGGPVLVNVDDDPNLEVLFHSSTGILHVLKANGEVMAEIPVAIDSGVTPLAGDLDGDGLLEMILTCSRTRSSEIKMGWLDFDTPFSPSSENRLSFAGNSARSGVSTEVQKYSVLACPKLAKSTGQVSYVPVGVNLLFSGQNTWRFDVSNPTEKRLLLLTEVIGPKASAQRIANHVFSGSERVTFNVAVSQPGKYRVSQQVIDPDNQTILLSHQVEKVFRGMNDERDYLEKKIFPMIEKNLASWAASNSHCSNRMTSELRSLRGKFVDVLQNKGDMAEVRTEAQRLLALSEAGEKLAPNSSLIVWESSPWTYFDPVASIPPTDKVDAKLQTALCQEEYESLALNLTNVSGETITVRARVDGGANSHEADFSQHVQLAESLLIPTERREMVSDALVPLNDAGTVVIPKYQSAQLWLTVHSKGLSPGKYEGRLVLKVLGIESDVTTVPIDLVVYPLTLPRPRPLRVCVWTTGTGGKMTADNDAVLTDLVEHGVTVFFPASPKGKWGQDGKRVGELDFSEHDRTVRRLAPHGFLLFLSPQSCVDGPAFLSEPWKQAFVSFVRDWVAHLNQLGLSYEDWAFYPYDEPSSPFTETTLHLVEVAKLIREADPNVLIYADPTSGTTMESVNMLTGLIDIWQPSSELLERLGSELLPVAKRVGKEVWFYDAAGGAKTLSCLGMYRHRFWFAWQNGLTGVGWWVYAHHSGEDLWDGPNATGDFFATVYDGVKGPISSKRWEASREGVEDYEYLVMLRDHIDAATREGISDDRIQKARTILAEVPTHVEEALRRIGRRIPLTPDSVPRYEEATRTLDAARREIVGACLELSEAK